MVDQIMAKVVFKTQFHPLVIHNPIEYDVNKYNTTQIYSDIIGRLGQKFYFNPQRSFTFFDEKTEEDIHVRDDRFLQAGHTYEVTVTYK